MNSSNETDKGKGEAQGANSMECTRLCVFCGKMFSRTGGLYAHLKYCKLNSNQTSVKNSKTLDSTSPLLCIYCGKAYTFKSGLSRHERICKLDDSPFYKCEMCFATFSRIDNFKNHTRKCNLQKSDFKSSRRSRCVYENCSAVFFHKQKLTMHLKKFHGSEIEEEQYHTFQSMEEFMKWKRIEEQKTHACFTKNTGLKGTTAYYHCQHNGSSKPHCKSGDIPRKTERRVKKGTVKQDRVCFAKMTLKVLNDSTCRVTYQPTHSHKLNVDYYHKSPLLTETVKFINHQFAMGVTRRECFKDFTDGSYHRNLNSSLVSIQESKPLFVTRTGSVDLSKRMKIKNGVGDQISVMMRAVLLLKEDPNPIIIYKPSGVGKVIGPNKIDKLPNAVSLFMLGIQSKEQRKMMLSHANILSISITNDTNVYCYPLLTLTAIDKYNRGYPVGFFISSSMDYDSVLCFFTTLNALSPGFHPNCIIMPHNPIIYNAIQEGLQMEIPHIWCLLEVHRDLQRALIDLTPNYLVQQMYDLLCSIISCTDRDKFQMLLNQFITDDSDTTLKFIGYFKEKYYSKVAHWSMAYRDFQYCNVDTTVYNEALHNHIKGHNQSMDDLMSILLDLEEDYCRKWHLEEILGIPLGIGNIITVCHANGLKIPDCSVIQINDILWEVSTDEELFKKCDVVKCSNKCMSNECYFVCNAVECNTLCSHLFACTCTDKNPICKHIHKVQELICRSKQVKAASKDIKNITESSTLININHYMNQLSHFLKDEQLPNKLVQRIETCLEDLVIECQTLISSEQEHAYTSRFELHYDTTDIIEESINLAKPEPNSPLQVCNNDAVTFLKFTPSLDFAKLSEIVLKYNIEELSFLHLKLLDPFLTSDDMSYIQESENFHNDWMYSTVVHAFFYQLEDRYPSVGVINSDVGFMLVKKETFKLLKIQRFVEKESLIIPLNLSNDHWTCVAVFYQKKEIVYYDSKGTVSDRDEAVIQNLQLLFAESVAWRVVLVNYDFQNDHTSCGAQVCHFAEQIATKTELTPLIDAKSYRKHIYESIVGGCLKRNHYSDTNCGRCNETICADVDEETAQLLICCDKCNQWFHIYCVGLQTMDITNLRFTCPV